MTTSSPSNAPAATDLSAAKIVRAAIHPAIGIARVGNSKDEFFFGPDVLHPPSEDPGFYKDDSGALKRQAALFRVYGYNAAGEAVAELTAKEADIEWTVHVANKKAAWYEFQIALDIPEANLAPPSLPRNANIQGADREKLAIDPGPRSIRGRDRQGTPYWFDTGKFFGKQVYLGELQTDELGRLVFLGGRGVSESVDGKPASTFANNDGWHDDVSDGPVTAKVEIDGVHIPCESAWVVVAPPNYAPDLHSVRTMYDLLLSVFVDDGQLPEPAEVSFRNDILPILERLNRLQWVNHGFAAGFGWTAPFAFQDPALLQRLSGTGVEFQELRREIYNTFRNYDRDGLSPVPWPWIYGDAMNRKAVSPRQYTELTSLQMRMLEKWVNGNFVDDSSSTVTVPHSLAAVDVKKQPAMLDEAALAFCLADAFHPGCEITWPIRHVTMFDKPFRIKIRPSGVPEPNYGPQLTPAIALGPNGPLNAQGPGDLSRWMAIPWQTDTASCRSGYDSSYDPFLPTFWPARVPNQVLSKADYAIAVNSGLKPAERTKHFQARQDWFRILSPNYVTAINQMIHYFGNLGVVEAHPQPAGDKLLPPVVYVESDPKPIPVSPPPVVAAAMAADAATAKPTRLADTEKARRFQ